MALVVGIIYPALLQALKVTPAQSSLEAPYIQRNISATRTAYGLNDVQIHQFPATNTITPTQTLDATSTIANVRQWDPDPTISLQTFQRQQAIRSYYMFPSRRRGPLHGGRAADARADRRARDPVLATSPRRRG